MVRTQYFNVLWFYAALKNPENTHSMFNGSILTTASFLVSFIFTVCFNVSGSNTCTDCVYYVILQKTGFTFNVCLYQIKNIVH